MTKKLGLKDKVTLQNSLNIFCNPSTKSVVHKTLCVYLKCHHPIYLGSKTFSYLITLYLFLSKSRDFVWVFYNLHNLSFHIISKNPKLDNFMSTFPRHYFQFIVCNCQGYRKAKNIFRLLMKEEYDEVKLLILLIMIFLVE